MRRPAAEYAMTGLAVVRIVNGVVAWCAPRAMNRSFGVTEEEQSPPLDYMDGVFGVRAIALGVGYLASRGEARRLWHRLWLMCDVADTVLGAGMVARNKVPLATATKALMLTGGAAAVDIAALWARRAA